MKNLEKKEEEGGNVSCKVALGTCRVRQHLGLLTLLLRKSRANLDLDISPPTLASLFNLARKFKASLALVPSCQPRPYACHASKLTAQIGTKETPSCN